METEITFLHIIALIMFAFILPAVIGWEIAMPKSTGYENALMATTLLLGWFVFVMCIGALIKYFFG